MEKDLAAMKMYEIKQAYANVQKELQRLKEDRLNLRMRR